MTIEISKLRAIVEADTLTAEERLAKVSAEFDRMGKTASTAAERSRAFNDVAGQMSIAGAAVGAAGIAAGAGLFKAASEAEQTKIAFTTMLGSGEKATAMLDELRAFAATTPFQFNDLTVASQRLIAMGFAAKDVIPIMTDVGDAVSGLGAGQEGIDRVVGALGKLQTGGKVNAEIMMQLTEVGIPAWKYLAEAVGTTTGEVQKMVTDGAIPAQTAIDALRAGMREDFGGLMTQQSQTAAGALSNLQDSADKLAATWGQTLLPVAKSVIGELQGVADALNALPEANRQTVVTVGGTVTAIGALAAGAAGAIPQLGKLGSAMSELTSASKLTGVTAVAAGGAVAAAAASWAIALGMVVDTIGKVQTGISNVNSALRDHEQTMRTTATSYDDYVREMLRANVAAGQVEQAYVDVVAATSESITANENGIKSLGLLTRAQFDATKSAEVGGEYQRELNRATAEFKPASDTAAQGFVNLKQAAKDAKEEQKAFQGVVDGFNRLVAGEVGKVNDDYIAQQAELRLKAADLTKELEKLQAAQGAQYTAENKNAMSANELNLAQLKLADAYKALGEEQKKTGDKVDLTKQAELQVQIDNYNEKITKATTVTTGFVNNGKRIGEIKDELGKVNDALDTNAAKYEDSMKRIAFSMLQERLVADGWQAGDMTMLAEVGEAWGIFDKKTEEMLTKVDDALTASGNNAQAFLTKMGYIYGLPDKTIKLNVETNLAATQGEDFGGWKAPATKTPAPLPKGVSTGSHETYTPAYGGPQAAGGDYMVDKPTWFLAGEAGPERATFTPVSAKGGAGGQTNISVSVSGVQDPETAANLVMQKLQDRGMISPAALR